MRTSRSFSSEPASARSARHFVLGALGHVPSRARDQIAIMVGELAMNAVQHARTDFEVTVEITGPTLRVTVTDSAGSRPEAGPMPPPGSLRGRGLPIVDSLADDWGVLPSPHGPGKTIWFELAVPSLAGLALAGPRFGRTRVAWNAGQARFGALRAGLDLRSPAPRRHRAVGVEPRTVLKNRSRFFPVWNLGNCAELGVLPRCR